MRGILCLEDGFYTTGVYAGPPRETRGEVVFYTGTGYDEALSHSCYDQKILVFTFPMIGTHNLPDTALDIRVRPLGLISRDIWLGWAGDSGTPLLDVLAKEPLPALTHVDTRGLVRHLTENGSLRGVIANLGGPDDLACPVPQSHVEFLVQKAREETPSCPKTGR